MLSMHRENFVVLETHIIEALSKKQLVYHVI